MPFRTVLLALLAAALMSGANSSFAQSQSKVEAATTASTAEPVVHLEGSVPAAKKVAITQFVVHFLDHQKAAAGSGGFGGGKRAEVEVKLAALPSAELLTQLAERLYADTLEQLKATGLETVALAELKALPIWKLIETSGKPVPLVTTLGFTTPFGGGVIVAPHGYRAEMLTGEDSYTVFGNDSPKQDLYLGATDKMGMQTLALSQAEGELVSSGAATHCLRVRLTVSLGDFSASSSMFSSAKAKAEARLQFAPYFTRWAVKSGGSSGFAPPRITLSESNPLGVVLTPVEADKSSSNTSGAGALFGLFGGRGSSAGTSMTVAVDPAVFADGVKTGHVQLAAAFAKRLVQAK